MKTKIFEYKGHVGIQAGDKFINDPDQPGQLGCLVDISEIEISKEAFDVLKTVKKSHDAIGDVMAFGTTFGWMGGYKYLLHPKAEGDRDYEPSILESRITEVEIPDDFKKVVDGP